MSATTHVEWTGTLTALSPLFVGGEELGDVDLAPVLDGSGDVFIPGTSLTGVIRSLLEEDGQEAFGSVDQVSAVRVDDAPVIDRGPLEVRDGVAIDRVRGAAADGVLFTRLVVPKGSTFEFRMTADVDDEGALDPIIALLTAPDGVAVGGATSRGLGRVRLDHNASRTATAPTRDGILDRLAGTTPGKSAKDLGLELDLGPREQIRIPWTAHGPVFVRSGAEGLAVDALPLVTRQKGESGKGDSVRLVIPGSSIKGVLRSHAERIERTVRGIDAPDGDVLDQVNDPRLAVTARLFGTARAGSDEATGSRSAVLVHDCLSIWKCSDNQWDAVVNAASATDPDRLSQLRPAIEALPKKRGEIQVGFHVGLDRWTSAPVDPALYSSLETYGMKWEPIRLTVDHRWLGSDDVAQAALFLLALVLRDFCDGWLAVGHGGWRGHGTVSADPTGIALDTDRWGAASLQALIDSPESAPDLRKAWCRMIDQEVSA